MSNDMHDLERETGIVDALATMRVRPPASFVDRVVGRWVRVDGPVGNGPFAAVYVAFTDQGVSFVRPAGTPGGLDEFLDAYRRRFVLPLQPASRPPSGLAVALRGGRASSLRFDLRGASPFERDVLEAAVRIPRGETRPYSWLAREIGRPGASRAVGSALGRNPVPVLIPCHRVTRSDGSTGEYLFGPPVKETLLRAEGVNLDEVRALASAHVFYLGCDTTRVFCLPTCHAARRIGAVHRRGFVTAAQAQLAGYRPCRRCRPA